MKFKAVDVKYGFLSVIYYFSLLLPPYIEHSIPWVTSICDIIKIAITLFLVLRYVFIHRGVSSLVILTAFYALVPAIVTFINGGKYISVIRNIIVLPAIVMWCDYIQHKGKFILVNSLSLLLESFIYINLLTILLVPDGLYQFEPIEGLVSDRVWFLGYRTGHNIYLIFGCICGYIRYLYSEKNSLDLIRIIVLFGASVATVILIGTGTGFVVITAFVVLIPFCAINKKVRMTFSWAILFHVVLFFAITVFFASQLFVGYFSLFNKSATLTGRTELWAFTWLRIIQSPIFGHGYMNDSDLMWLRLLAGGATTSHNALLDMLFRGGIVTFALFILILIDVGRCLKRNGLSLFFNNTLICLYICMFFVMQAESGMDSVVLFTMISLIAILPDIGSANPIVKRTGAIRGAI